MIVLWQNENPTRPDFEHVRALLLNRDRPGAVVLDADVEVQIEVEVEVEIERYRQPALPALSLRSFLMPAARRMAVAPPPLAVVGVVDLDRLRAVHAAGGLELAERRLELGGDQLR